MKEIFDWLREQIESKSNYEPVDYDYCDMACGDEQGYIAREDALDAINEAEAKWEEDCCEWKISEFADYWIPSCCRGESFHLRGVRKFKHCPYCGKRIKISEVE